MGDHPWQHMAQQGGWGAAAEVGGWGNQSGGSGLLDDNSGGSGLLDDNSGGSGLLDDNDPLITATEVAERYNVPPAAARRWVTDRPFRKSSQAAANRHYEAKSREAIDPMLFVECMAESGMLISLDDSKTHLDEYQGDFTWQDYQDASAEYEANYPDVQRCEVGGWGEPDVQAGGW